VSAYHRPITDHSLHVYHSALATTASSELLTLYAEDRKGVPSLITEREQTQGGWLKLLEGHEGNVLSVAFSSNGKMIVSASEDRTVRVWDTVTGVVQHKMTGHERGVTSVAFSLDGKTIVSGSYDRTVRVWDADTGVEQHKMTGYGLAGVTSVAFSPDGKTIVSGSDDQTVRVWDAATGVEQHKITGHEDTVFSVAYSHDGKTIVSGSWDETVRVWDAATGAERHKMTGHDSAVESVAFSPDGKTIVSGSRGGTVRIWDAATGVEQHKVTGHAGISITSVAFSPDGKRIISKDHYSGTPCTWDVDTGARLTRTTSIAIDTSRHPSTEHLVFQLDSHGWISCSSRGGAWQRVCWIPIQRRGDTFEYSGEIVCIGASTGAITILDFSPLGLAR
jgi:WD40 repeat protein